MRAHRGTLCRGPYGGEGDRPHETDCADPAVFEIARYERPPLRVCPVHLGPSLLMAGAVLWPPGITLVGRP